jgi:deoxyribodipyrimidine photo-lyase
MRQLNTIGFMHNRIRLIVGNFLIKILHINWELGELYFAKQLIDYDPSQNNGNWQWLSGGGVDSQPYFRIFNPWLQTERFDSECKYIKKWVPELRSLSADVILNWNTEYSKYHTIKYPKPIVDYGKEKNQTMEMYLKIY